jgi:hypothetical protein
MDMNIPARAEAPMALNHVVLNDPDQISRLRTDFRYAAERPS